MGIQYKVPPRPFIRPVQREKAAEVMKTAAEGITKAFFKRGTKTAITFHAIEKTLSKAAKIIELAIVKKIFGHIPPPLSPFTIEYKIEKGYILPSTPLIATGRAVSSVTHRIIRANSDGTLAVVKAESMSPFQKQAARKRRSAQKKLRKKAAQYSSLF